MSTNFTYVRGNLLAGVDSNVLYEYNKDGARFQKTVDGVATKYFLDGHRIMGENRGSNTIRYFYDIDGLCGIRYNGQNYNVVRDALGNVVAITQGVEIRARYEYDSLGNCKVYKLGNSTIGDVNPFRWKGHYFDTETGFYYINGRYYDPQTASFLDAESVSAVFASSGNPLALDRNGIACVNTFAFAINATNVFTHLEMFADINYDINANKPWWEIAWNAVVNWFNKTLLAIAKWYNNLIMYVDPDGNEWNCNTFWKGLGMVAIAVSAIALSVTTFGAGIPLAMSIIAGITLVAGVLTGINGVATMIEAVDGYNFVRDGLFNDVLGLSDESYDIYAGITEGIAIAGSAILGVYHTTGQYKAAKYGQKFLGPGYKKAGHTNAGTARYVSKDGMRQMRFDRPHMYKGKKIGKHMNLEIFKGNKPVSHEHVFYKWFKMWID